MVFRVESKVRAHLARIGSTQPTESRSTTFPGSSNSFERTGADERGTRRLSCAVDRLPSRGRATHLGASERRQPSGGWGCSHLDPGGKRYRNDLDCFVSTHAAAPIPRGAPAVSRAFIDTNVVVYADDADAPSKRDREAVDPRAPGSGSGPGHRETARERLGHLRVIWGWAPDVPQPTVRAHGIASMVRAIRLKPTFVVAP